MPRTLRKRQRSYGTIAKVEPVGRGRTFSGQPVQDPNLRRKYTRAQGEQAEPLMQEAFAKLRDKPFKTGWKIKAMKKANRDESKDYKAAWLDKHRDFAEDRCLLFPAFVEFRSVFVKYNYTRMSAPRAMLIMTQGLNESGVVAHKCGNGHLSCVNPQHLYWADAKQNARDRVLHDPNTPPVEITEEQRRAIEADERLHSVIAWATGIPVSQVRDIKASIATYQPGV